MHVHVLIVTGIFGACSLFLLAGCTPAATVEVAPGGLGRLSEIDTVQVAEARVEKGSGVSTDFRHELAAELTGRLRALPVEVGIGDGTQGEGGEPLILVYRRSDFLPGYPRHQSNDRWYWWGLLLDRHRGRLASLHGEMEKEAGDPEKRFSKELKRLLRDARKLRP